MEVALAVYMCDPTVDVSKCPLPPLAPFESAHDDSPGPLAASVQVKLVATTWPSEFVPYAPMAAG